MRISILVSGALVAAVLAGACRGQSGAGPSPVSPSSGAESTSGGGTSPASEAALLGWVLFSHDQHGVYFLPHMSLDAHGNPVIAGVSTLVIFRILEDGGSAVCMLEPDGANSFFRIGPNGAMDHVSGHARMEYRRFGPGLVLIEELAGRGRLNMQIQGELQTIVVDGENGETETILTIGNRSSAEVVTAAGKVEPISGGAARDLRCGLRREAKGDEPRTYIELR